MSTHIANEFNNTQTECYIYYEKAFDISRGISENLSYIIIEIAFLRIYLAWEYFLQSIFIYCCTKGAHKVRSYIKFPSEKEATDFLNQMEGSRGYTDWCTPDRIIDRANVCFAGGQPFNDVICCYKNQLQWMKKVRNKIAHNSLLAQKDFMDLMKGITGSVPEDITPGKFLAGRAPKTMLGTEHESASPTVYQLWNTILNYASKEIYLLTQDK